jgi:hypothetical protein
MRIAIPSNHLSRLHRERTFALTRAGCLAAEPPFTHAPSGTEAFDPSPTGGHASLGVETVYRLLQNRAKLEHRPRACRYPASGRRGDDPPQPWPERPSAWISPGLAGKRGLASRAPETPPKRSHRAWTGPTRVKVREVFRRANPLLDSDRTPLCRARAAWKGGAFSLCVCTGWFAICANEMRQPSRRPPVLHRPAKGGAFARRPRCVPPSCVMGGARISPAPRRRGLPPRGTVRSGERRRFAVRDPAPLQP